MKAKRRILASILFVGAYAGLVSLLEWAGTGRFVLPGLVELAILAIVLILAAICGPALRVAVVLAGFGLLCLALPPAGSLRIDWKLENLIRVVVFPIDTLGFLRCAPVRNARRSPVVASGDSFLA